MSLDAQVLISEIQKRPLLYDTSIPENADKCVRIKMWEEVCMSLFPEWNDLDLRDRIQRTEEVKRRWKSLKDCFRRELAIQTLGNFRSNKNKKRKKKYIYFDQLQFLTSSIGHGLSATHAALSRKAANAASKAESDSGDEEGVYHTEDDVETQLTEQINDSPQRTKRRKHLDASLEREKSPDVSVEREKLRDASSIRKETPRDVSFQRENPRDTYFHTETPRRNASFQKKTHLDASFQKENPRDAFFQKDKNRDDVLQRENLRDDVFQREKPRDASFENELIQLLSKRIATEQNDDDADKQFLLSLLPSMKKFDEDDKMWVRIEIMNAIRKVQDEISKRKMLNELQDIPAISNEEHKREPIS